MRKINENAVAQYVAGDEGLKESLSIAQIKEVIKLTLDWLACECFEEPENMSGVMAMLEKHVERVRR